DSSFAEHFPGGTQATPKDGSASPYNFPYATHRAKLGAMALEGGADPIDKTHGHRLHYGDGPTLPTIDAWLRLLPAGFRSSPYRSTDATVFCVAEGHGQSRIADELFSWGPHDIFMVPSWAT